MKMSLQRHTTPQADSEEGGGEQAGRQAGGQAVKGGKCEEGPHCQDHLTPDSKGHRKPPQSWHEV